MTEEAGLVNVRGVPTDSSSAVPANGGGPPAGEGDPPPPEPIDTRASTPAGGMSRENEEARFLVDLPGYRGTLEDLLHLAQRGEIDLAGIPVADITRGFRERLVDGHEAIDPREVADFLTLASRLLSLKAAKLLPDGPIEAPVDEAAEEPVDDPGARLAEYRLFKAAAEALLADATDHGVRAFLGLVSAEVVPAERLVIAPERLAAAFRAVLARLPAIEPVGPHQERFSVDEKVGELRALLTARRRLDFHEVFAGARSRMEAVAIFLALLELVRAGEARVEQAGPFDAIRVSAVG
jgi:segregation and condensation protein A